MTLIGLRGRLSLIASLLLMLTCLMAVAIVCTCSSDHFLQSIERIVQSTAAALPAAVVFCVVTAMLAATGISLVIEPDGRGA